MNRRHFVQLATLGSVAGIITPQALLAEAKMPVLTGAGGLFYTKDNPGRWEKKVGGHLPHLTVESSENGIVKLKVETDHVMQTYQHYIVKHMLLDEKFQVLDEHMFDPEKEEEPISHHELQHSGIIYAVSVCNKHDTWLNVFEV